MNQRLDQALRVVMQEKCAVEKVHPDDAEGFLLQLVLVVQHAHVDDDLAVLIARMRLELDADPPVAVVGPGEVTRRHGVRESEEGRGVTAGVAQALQVQLVLVVEHALQALARDVALGVPIDGVTDGHVVSGDALGDGARRAAHAKEPAHHFLTGADLGERSVAPRVQVDGERLAVRIEEAVLNERSTR